MRLVVAFCLALALLAAFEAAFFGEGLLAAVLALLTVWRALDVPSLVVLDCGCPGLARVVAALGSAVS